MPQTAKKGERAGGGRGSPEEEDALGGMAVEKTKKKQ
jgi:hypothetical protein